MESKKISELEQYNGSADGFMIPGVADGETQKANLGTMIEQQAEAAGFLKPDGLKTINGESVAGSGDLNVAVMNPLKGTYLDTDTLPTEGQAGDYIYVVNTNVMPRTANVYAWNGTAFADTGKSVEDFGQAFASGQALPDVAIKDENGEDVTGNADVLSAGAGATLKNTLFETSEGVVEVPVSIHTEEGNNGRWKGTDGSWVNDNMRRSTDKISVVEGEQYLVTVNIGASTGLAYLGQWDGATYKGIATGFEAGSGNAVDRPYTVPEGVNLIAMSSYDTNEPSLKKVENVSTLKFYTKTEIDDKIKIEKQYGVRWNLSDPDDSGERILDAVGLTASISVGNSQGNSDFDNIYPWSEIKRCNIKHTSAGAKFITAFEGDSGFALDGSNGDVFVRLPKFCIQKYIKDGYEYRIISEDIGDIHPVFIEDGKVLDEVFISAFEGYIDTNDELRSIAGKIPTGDKTFTQFLNAATNNGPSYSLYDSRCVDALFNLFAVEYGCRNTTVVFGNGVADLDNPVPSRRIQSYTEHSISIIPEEPDAAKRKKDLTRYAVGQVVTICHKTTHDFQVLLQAVITSVTDPGDYTQPLVLNFAETLDTTGIDTGTLAYGNGPDVTNYTETCGSNNEVLGHTGRATIPVVAGSSLHSEQISPVRYRWIENPFGNIWQMLPDIVFNDFQMYVCKSIKDYAAYSITPPYLPYGNLYPEQNDNNANFVTKLNDDYFSKYVPFGAEYVAESGTDLEGKYYGAAYYLKPGTAMIVNGGGWDHVRRCNLLTNRAWLTETYKWYLYGARLQCKNI